MFSDVCCLAFHLSNFPALWVHDELTSDGECVWVLLRTTVLRCPKLLGLRADHRAHQAGPERPGPESRERREPPRPRPAPARPTEATDPALPATRPLVWARRAARTQQNWY